MTLFLFLAISVLAGCASKTPVLETLEHLTHTPLAIPVRNLEVHVHPAAGSCSFEGTLVKSRLVSMAQQWAQDGLSAEGGEGFLRIHILRAFIEEKEIPCHHGVMQSLSVQGRDKYEGSLKVRFEWMVNNVLKHQMQIVLKGERVNMENLTLYQRQANLMALQNELINRLTSEAKQVLPKMFHGEDL